MPLTSIDLVEFQKLGSELAKLMNSCFKTEIYTVDCVEIIQSAKDYNDGKGYRLVSCAAVRNPIDGLYDLYLDMIGTPEEAITHLKAKVEELIASGAIIIKSSHNKNSTVLN